MPVAVSGTCAPYNGAAAVRTTIVAAGRDTAFRLIPAPLPGNQAGIELGDLAGTRHPKDRKDDGDSPQHGVLLFQATSDRSKGDRVRQWGECRHWCASWPPQKWRLRPARNSRGDAVAAPGQIVAERGVDLDDESEHPGRAEVGERDVSAEAEHQPVVEAVLMDHQRDRESEVHWKRGGGSAWRPVGT